MIWTDEEKKILTALYPRSDLTKFDIAKILTNRSPSAISRKASDMQLKKEPKIHIDYERMEEVKLFEI